MQLALPIKWVKVSLLGIATHGTVFNTSIIHLSYSSDSHAVLVWVKIELRALG